MRLSSMADYAVVAMVAAARHWIMTGEPAAEPAAITAAANLFTALETGQVRVTTGNDGRVAIVRGYAPGALRLGYRVAPVVVAIDPAVTANEDSDLTGIIVAGLTPTYHVLVIDDLSCKESPLGWARIAIAAYKSRRADRIVAEVNNGGDLVAGNIRAVDPNIAFRAVRASRGKAIRAEPVAALYEQGRVSHVGEFATLEDQMTGWLPDSGYSPDRLDALVHALAELKLATGSSADRFFAQLAPPCGACGQPNEVDSFGCKNCGVSLRTPEAQLYSSGINPSHRGQ